MNCILCKEETDCKFPIFLGGNRYWVCEECFRYGKNRRFCQICQKKVPKTHIKFIDNKLFLLCEKCLKKEENKENTKETNKFELLDIDE